jgi:hypothetical protein
MNRSLSYLALLGALSSNAVDLKARLSAQCFDHTFSYYEYQFRMTLPMTGNEEISQIRVTGDFSGQDSINSSGRSGPFSGFDEQTTEFTKTANENSLQWTADRKMFYMATGGYVSHWNFRLEWTGTDGTLHYDPAPQMNDHGEWVFPRYQSEIFKPFDRECWHLRNAIEIPYGLPPPPPFMDFEIRK